MHLIVMLHLFVLCVSAVCEKLLLLQRIVMDRIIENEYSLADRYVQVC